MPCPKLVHPGMPPPVQASAASAKAQFDKFVLDKAEEKAEFDRALEHSIQETAAMKAVADKALLDMGEVEVRVGVTCSTKSVSISRIMYHW